VNTTHRIARAAVITAFFAGSASVLAQQPVEVPLPSQAPPWKIVNQHGDDVACDTSPWQKVDLGTVAGVHIYSGDHCSMPSPDPISEKFKQVFSRACDLHDVCYLTPGNAKPYCDDLVKWRWDQDCSHAYSSSNPIGRDECHVAAKAWRTGLNSSISDQYWSRSQAWGGQHCRVDPLAVGSANGLTWLPIAPNGSMPPGAVFAAAGSTSAVCRVQYQGGLHAGRVVGTNCDIGYGGREMPLPGGQVLNAIAPVAWFQSGPNGSIPGTPVVAGLAGGERMVVCRAAGSKGMLAGKVVAGRCNIASDGKESAEAQFQVLATK
jgi:hypothetical protein